MKWNACGEWKALISGAQWRPSGQIVQIPHSRSSRSPWLSKLEKAMRPSASTVGCRALPMVIGAIAVTLPPSSSMTKSWRVGLV